MKFPIGWLAIVALTASFPASAQTGPTYFADPSWPKPLPNNWKFGGITGLTVDAAGNIWVLNRPNDLSDIELLAEFDRLVYGHSVGHAGSGLSLRSVRSPIRSL